MLTLQRQAALEVDDVDSGHHVIFNATGPGVISLWRLDPLQQWVTEDVFSFIHPAPSHSDVWSYVIETTLLLLTYSLIPLMKWFPHHIVLPFRLPGQTVIFLFVLPSASDERWMRSSPVIVAILFQMILKYEHDNMDLVKKVPPPESFQQ